MLSFALVAEALTGLIYHRPSGENSSFVFQNLRIRRYLVQESRRAGKREDSDLATEANRRGIGELSLISQSEQIC